LVLVFFKSGTKKTGKKNQAKPCQNQAEPKKLSQNRAKPKKAEPNRFCSKKPNRTKTGRFEPVSVRLWFF